MLYLSTTRKGGTKNEYKNSITTLLSEIMYVIPKEVVLTSIENPSAKKVIINANLKDTTIRNGTEVILI